MKILTAAEMGSADRLTVERFGVPFADLMERAGSAVAAFVRSQYPAARRVVVLCGTGNNGGDGFVAARALLSTGVRVSVILLGDQAKLQGAAAAVFGLLDRSAIDVTTISESVEAEALADALRGADLVLDAVVGTGFKPPLRGVAAIVRDALAKLPVPIVAVDLPSGWDADSTEQTVESAFRANAVVTFTAPKLAHVFGHLTAPDVFGPVVVAPIGSPEETVESATGFTWTGTSKRIFEAPRPIDSNKGMYGHVLLIGGAFGKAGAPSMSSLAALRAGAGLVTAAVPKSILNNVALITPELMIAPLDEDESGSVALSNAEPERRDRLLKKITVLAIGPGLGTEGDASAFVRRMVAETGVSLVLDADGLNAFKGQPGLLKDASRGGERAVVLTPASRGNGHAARHLDQGGAGGSGQSRAALCHGAWRDSCAEGLAHAGCAS